MIRPRSSAFRKGLLLNGTIDEGYRGELSLQIRNISNYPIKLEPNKAYAQLIIVNYNPEVELQEVVDLSETERGQNGLGSSGNN